MMKTRKQISNVLTVAVSTVAVLAGTAAAQFVDTYSTPGTDTFVVPAGVSSVTVKAWGAGGGGGRNDSLVGGTGGGGGFVGGTYAVSLGDELSITVGAGGGVVNTGKSAGGGGGWTGVSNGTANAVIVVAGAGGAGAGGDNKNHTAGDGGAGGGTTGMAGGDSIYTSGGATTPSTGGQGGTQIAGGAGGASDGGTVNGADGAALVGGTGGRGPGGGAGGAPGGGAGGPGVGYDPGGGGGGSGWYGGGGGGGGALSHVGGAGGGGGGSSYADPAGSDISNTAGSGTTPGNNGDPVYADGAGVGGANGAPGDAGGNGLIVISYDVVGVMVIADLAVDSITANSAQLSALLGGLDGDVTVYWEAGTVADPAAHTGWDGTNGPSAETQGTIVRAATSLTPDTFYTYAYYGVDSASWSGAATFSTALSEAQAPAFNSPVPATVSIQLGWQDNASNETSYILQRSPNPSSGPYTYTDVGNTTTYTDSGLLPETAYYYELAATNSANGSATTFSLAQTSATTLAPVERFVATSGSDTVNDGLSWSSPYATISNALAQGDAHTITVSNGTYTITAEIAVTDPGFPVTIRSYGNGVTGGLANAASTVIDHGGSGSRVFNISHADAVLDGLTITGGSAANGGGVQISAGCLNHCIVEYNSATTGGGGVYMPGGGSGIISNCTVQSNGSSGDNNNKSGGGILTYSGTITHCRVLDNGHASGRYGGGIGCGGSGTLIRNTLIARNYATGGGSGCGGGIFVYQSGPTIESCTIVSNRATRTESSDYAGGISLNASATVRNCIVYFNTYGAGASDYPDFNTYPPTYTCAPEASSGEGNIIADPLFVDLAGGNYRLTADSPCIDAGDDTGVTWPTDLDGNDRIIDAKVDMGAYENNTPPSGTVIFIR